MTPAATAREETDRKTRDWLNHYPNEYVAINQFRRSLALPVVERRTISRLSEVLTLAHGQRVGEHNAKT